MKTERGDMKEVRNTVNIATHQMRKKVLEKGVQSVQGPGVSHDDTVATPPVLQGRTPHPLISLVFFFSLYLSSLLFFFFTDFNYNGLYNNNFVIIIFTSIVSLL